MIHHRTVRRPWANHGQTMGTAGRPQAPKPPPKRQLTSLFTESGRRDSNPRPSPRQREENRPSSPSSPVTWSPVRLFVRPARPVRLCVYRSTIAAPTKAAARRHLDGLADDLAIGAVAVTTDERIRVRRLPLPPTNDYVHATSRQGFEGADRRLGALFSRIFTLSILCVSR